MYKQHIDIFEIEIHTYKLVIVTSQKSSHNIPNSVKKFSMIYETLNRCNITAECEMC